MGECPIRGCSTTTTRSSGACASWRWRFPDAAEKVSHGSPAFYTTKVFAYYGGSEKVGDGYERHGSSLLVLADPVERPALLDDPRGYLPMYLGPSRAGSGSTWTTGPTGTRSPSSWRRRTG